MASIAPVQRYAEKMPEYAAQDHPHYRIRRCHAADAAMLSLVGGATFLQTYAPTHDAADILAHATKNHSTGSYERLLAVPENRAYFAEIEPGGAAIGYILCAAPDLPAETVEPGDYELRRIYLLHRFQGLGIGQALMRQAIDAAREQGYRRLTLGVYGKNHDALRFYERSGFREIGERTFTVGRTVCHDYVLARRL